MSIGQTFRNYRNSITQISPGVVALNLATNLAKCAGPALLLCAISNVQHDHVLSTASYIKDVAEVIVGGGLWFGISKLQAAIKDRNNPDAPSCNMGQPLVNPAFNCG